MGAFGSRGGLFLQAPLKRERCKISPPAPPAIAPAQPSVDPNHPTVHPKNFRGKRSMGKSG